MIKQQHLAVGANHSGHFPQPRNGVGDRAEHTGRRHGVERAIRIGQGLDVGKLQVYRPIQPRCDGAGT